VERWVSSARIWYAYLGHWDLRIFASGQTLLPTATNPPESVCVSEGSNIHIEHRDPPFTENDRPKRSHELSTNQINLRQHGTRGNCIYPAHPELFIGSIGSEPRGRLLDPRLNLLRDQMEPRINQMQIRMGYNDDSHVTEKPMTNQAIDTAIKDIQKTLTRNIKVFPIQKENTIQPHGRTYVDHKKWAQSQISARNELLGDTYEDLQYSNVEGNETLNDYKVSQSKFDNSNIRKQIELNNNFQDERDTIMLKSSYKEPTSGMKLIENVNYVIQKWI